LTSPLTDWEIVLGKYLGVMSLYAVMLAVTALNFVWLFAYGNPEFLPIVVGYLGLLLMGGSFLAIGLFISNLTRNQLVAAALTFSVLLMLLLINWIGDASGPVVRGLV